MEQRCVIYVRVSTPDQKLESQIEDLKKWAEYNSYLVDKVFPEKASGYDQTVERPVYDEMKEYVIQNRINHVAMWELSRLSRNTIKSLQEIEYFKNHGVNLFFKKEQLNTISDNVSNKLLLSLLSSVAEIERDTFISRTRRGKTNSAQKGKRVGFALMPYGFFSDNGFIKVEDTEAEIVKEIYTKFSNNQPIRSICNDLNARDIPTRNTGRGKLRKLRSGQTVKILWRPVTVRKILKSTLYKGERNYTGGVVVKIQGIVDIDLWNKVQDIFKNHIGYKIDTTYQYLLKGKIHCGQCKLAYLSRTDKVNKGIASFYFCSGRKDKSIKCKNGQFHSGILDENVYNLLFRHPDIIKTIYKENIEKFSIVEKHKQIAYFEAQILHLEGSKRKTIKLYRDDYISESEFNSDMLRVKNDMADMNTEIQKVKKEIENFNMLKMDSIDLFKSMAQETNFEIKKGFVNKYIDDILLYRVEHTDIKFEDLVTWELGIDTPHPKQIKLRKLHGNDKLMYVEIFCFGNKVPLKVIMSNLKGICYSSDKLTYNSGRLYLNDTEILSTANPG